MNEYMMEQAMTDAYESALRFNPETLEYNHPADGPFVDSLPERFVIDSDKKARAGNPLAEGATINV